MREGVEFGRFVSYCVSNATWI